MKLRGSSSVQGCGEDGDEPPTSAWAPRRIQPSAGPLEALTRAGSAGRRAEAKVCTPPSPAAR